jgi:hypothetical protein
MTILCHNLNAPVQHPQPQTGHPRTLNLSPSPFNLSPPTRSGVHACFLRPPWIPACAGMTNICHPRLLHLSPRTLNLSPSPLNLSPRTLNLSPSPFNLSPPTRSGVHACFLRPLWIPACAGMTNICHPRLLHLSPPNPQLVTPDSIGGPCLLPSPTMDTRMRGYDRYRNGTTDGQQI